eukprot:UN05377
MNLDGEDGAAGDAGLDIEGDKEEFPECVYDRLLGVELSTLIATYIAKEQHNPQSAFVTTCIRIKRCTTNPIYCIS